MKKKYLVFDFDGTISDSAMMIFRIINELSEKFGFKKIPERELERYREMGTEGIIKELQISKEHIPQIFKEINQGIADNAVNISPVKGMAEVIRSLDSAGYKMDIVTSDTKNNVDKFLKKFEIVYFQNIFPEAGLYGKAVLLRKLINKLKVPAENVLYIGDETRDIDAGRACGVKTAAVTWGINGKEALMAKKPDWLIEKPEELLKL